MSIDIGIVTAATFDYESSPEDTLVMHRAEALWRHSPELAFAGHGLFSAEASPDMDRSMAISALSYDYPDRFITLVSHLSPLIQDIFFQYYLLGRTYAQIGLTLFPGKTPNAQCILVKTGNRLGLRALAALIKCGSQNEIMSRGPSSPFRQAWEEASAWRSTTRCRNTTLRAPRDLGDFIIVPNGQLRELFAPSWSVLGPSASGGSQ